MVDILTRTIMLRWTVNFCVAQICVVVALSSLPGRGFSAEQPVSGTFKAKGVKIHYLIQGKGAAVVLIHGLNSSADINWRLPGIMAELARDHQVIALDLPGHGRSDKPAGEEAYGLQVVEDVVLLLDHLEIKKAHIVGYSLGGMVAAKLMARHPERVLSGTLGGMGWFREGSALQKLWERMPAREGARTPPVFLQSVGKLALTEEELKKIRVPVKILIGDRDPSSACTWRRCNKQGRIGPSSTSTMQVTSTASSRNNFGMSW